MKVVIDIGCNPLGGDSLGKLARDLEPDVLYGFDPAPSWDMAAATPLRGEMQVHLERKAAWVHDGILYWHRRGYGITVDSKETGGMPVPCFDLAEFIRGFPTEDEIILKIDAEGSEYAILEHLLEHGVDERISLLWIEWHDLPEGTHVSRRVDIERRWRSQIDEWNL